MTAGLAYKTSPKSVVAFDTEYIWYSQIAAVGNPFSNLYTYEGTGNSSYGLGGSNGPGFGWKDTTFYKLGYQSKVSEKWTARIGIAYGQEPVRSSDVLFNILAPGVSEWHYAVGATKEVSTKSEISGAFVYSPPTTVTGPNPLDPTENIALQMHQYEFEATYAVHY